MNYSDLERSILTYLGFFSEPTAEMRALIGEILPRVKGAARFRRAEGRFTALPFFLSKEPYLNFLSGCHTVILEAVTLGAEVDLLIRRLSKEDLLSGFVADACASALLEAYADDAEDELGDERTYRFCSGYGGSDVEDIQYILESVKAEKIGITRTESGLMLPQKSMAGIVGLGKKTQKSCGECILKEHCAYRKEGRVCFEQ